MSPSLGRLVLARVMMISSLLVTMGTFLQTRHAVRVTAGGGTGTAGPPIAAV